MAEKTCLLECLQRIGLRRESFGLEWVALAAYLGLPLVGSALDDRRHQGTCGGDVGGISVPKLSQQCQIWT